MPSTCRTRALWHVVRRSLKTQVPSKARPIPGRRVSPKETSPSHRPKTEPQCRVDSLIPLRRPPFYDRFLPKNERSRRLLLLAVLASPAGALLLLHAPFEPMWVNGPSMSPLFNSNYASDEGQTPRDHILVQKGLFFSPNQAKLRARGEFVPRELFTAFQRGQIITFHVPHNPEKVAVKRVVAVPGDRVQPLPGYPGGEGLVVVPWNHLWVEGDADSREKSVDSNWYGPISQNLVIGEVKAVLSPWYRPRWIDWRQHRYPAFERGRVEENAVQEAAENPKVVDQNRRWTDGRNAKLLGQIEDNADELINKWSTHKSTRAQLKEFYRNAALVVAASDPDSEKHELASHVIRAMEDIFGRPELREGWIKRQDLSLRSRDVKKIDTDAADKEAAVFAESNLRAQGWQIERGRDGKVKTKYGGL